jgi:hypothetical protein
MPNAWRKLLILFMPAQCAEFLQTVRKVPTFVKTVDQNVDFRVELNLERSEASKFGTTV